MPTIELTANHPVTREQLRTFHLTGRGLDAFLPPGPLRPALLDQLQLPRIEQSYPLYYSATESPQPFVRRLQAVVDAHPSSFPVLRDYLELIAGAFAEHIPPDKPAPVASILDPALAVARTRLELLHVHPQMLEGEFGVLRKALAGDGCLIPFSGSTLNLLSSTIFQTARQDARLAFANQLKQRCQRLQELLDLDDRKSVAASSAEQVAASLGARAVSFLRPSALAEALRRRSNPTVSMEPERRARCQSALATLESAIFDLNKQPPVVLIQPAGAHNADACHQAMTLWRQQLEQYVATWKALRIARLEVESAFDPAIHLEALDSFDWSMAQPDELAALPPIIVLESAPRIEQCLASFAKLLQSGLPIHVLVACPDGPSGNLGCLPLAYQEVFALHSSIARPDHLAAGLSEMARTLRPSVAVVAADNSWTEAALLPLARAWPLYRYHPDLGESWYQRFAFESDQAPQYKPLHFAQVAALMPAFRNQFRILPEAAGALDPVFPFFFVTGENGEQSRAVFTRELAQAGAEAERRWRFLAELAAPKVIKEVDASAEKQARLDGATHAIQQVISILTNTWTG